MNPAKTSTYIKTQATARHAYPGDILETERFNTTLTARPAQGSFHPTRPCRHLKPLDLN
jgi:hypothetical protein